MLPDDPRPDTGRRVPEFATRSLWVAALFSGAMCAALAASAACVVALVCWLPDAGASGDPISTLRAGLLAFLAAHHGGLRLDGVGTAFVPLGMTLLLLVFGYRAGTTLAEIAEDLDEHAPQRLAQALGLQTAAYLVVCLLVCLLATDGSSSAAGAGLGVACVVVFGSASGASLCRRTALGRTLAARLPAGVRAAARPVAAAGLVLLAGGALLVAGSLARHASTVMALSRVVGGGLSGLPVLLLGVLAAPNAVVAGTAYLAGPGFAVGVDTHVSAISTTHGLVPSFPLLGALPTGSGAPVPALALLAAVQAAAGLALAWPLRPRAWRPALRDAVIAAGLLGLAWTVLAWQAGGGVGSGRLRAVGPSPWQVGLAVAVETGTGAALVLTVLAVARWWRGRDTDRGEPEPTGRVQQTVDA